MNVATTPSPSDYTEVQRYGRKQKSLDQIVSEALALSGQAEDRTTTLPPECYTSQDFFDLEMERIFRRDWHIIGHVAQVPNVGDYVAFDFLEAKLMIVHGADDKIRVMSRSCLHRWMPLVEGQGNAKVFSCPFHKWTYSLDGQLRGAPLMDRAADFEPKSCKLPEVTTQVDPHGFVYITLNESPAPFAEKVAGLDARFANYDLANAKIAFTSQFICNFNWKIAAETFMECYHHIGAHLNTLEKKYPAALSWVEDTHAGWTYCHNPEVKVEGEDDSVTRLPEFPGLRPDEGHGINLYHLYPSSLIGMGRNRVGWTGLTPIAPGKTLWTRLNFVTPEAMEHPDFEAEIEKARTRGKVVNDEDIVVDEAQQVGAASWGVEIGRLSHLEKVVWQLANYVRSQIAQ